MVLLPVFYLLIPTHQESYIHHENLSATLFQYPEQRYPHEYCSIQ